jgi:glutamate formiminotransferase/formiminotetrahydrofolate cyclodeaminase
LHRSAGVGALCARSAVMGAYLNVRINTSDLTDKEVVADYLARGKELQGRAQAREAEILAVVESKL